jgi:uncharacterized protein YndB with AHSA1/START domain
MRFTNTITIDRPLTEVFEFLARLENLPLWNYAISDTEKISSGAVGVGSRYRQTRTVPARSEETFEVTEFKRDHRLSIRGSLGPFHSEVTYLLTPDEDGTVLTNTMKLQPAGPMRLVAPLAAPGIKSAVAANLGVLKQLLEERPAGHR